MFEKWDYTIGKYQVLCKAIQNSRYKNVTIKEYLELDGKDKESFILVRHDIDRCAKRALDTALVENEHNVKATYYFRMTKDSYIPEIIDTIASLGHEIGYHYETADKCRGNLEKAVQLFSEELQELSKRYEIKTACAHGNPLTRYDNKTIWGKCRFSDFGLLGEPYLSIDYNEVAYFTESGRTWTEDKAQKIKDAVNSKFDHVRIKSTDDLIEVVNRGNLPNICILTHPERWTKGRLDFLERYILDIIFRWGKLGLYLIRHPCC